MDEVEKVLADFEPFFHGPDRKSQPEAVYRFARRIDLGVAGTVVHWRLHIALP